MPKLPPLSPQKVIAILEKKGFVLKKVTGSHYIFANAETKRRVTVPFLEVTFLSQLLAANHILRHSIAGGLILFFPLRVSKNQSFETKPGKQAQATWAECA